MLTLYRQGFPSLFQGFWPSRRRLESGFFGDLSRGEDWFPRVDVTHENGEFTVKAELPGIDKDDIHVDVHEGVLTLRGEKKSEYVEDSEGCRCSERYWGSFERSFVLPAEAKVDDIRAHLDKGVLTITLPAAPAVEEVKKIEVTVN